MATPQQIYKEKVAQQIIKALEKRRMAGTYAPTIAQAREEVAALIPDGASVFRCGSTSLVEMGLWERLQGQPQDYRNRSLPSGIFPGGRPRTRRRGLTADFMIASSNAITLDGKLVNLDGMGNRVAAMAFGPKKVILVVGLNKVALTLERPWTGPNRWPRPLNCIRLNINNPCQETGLCSDCHTPTRICNIWSIIEGQAVKDRIQVKLVGENLGY